MDEEEEVTNETKQTEYDQEHKEDEEEEGTVEYLDLDFEGETIPETVEYYSTSALKSHNARHSKKSYKEIKLPSQTSILKSNYNTAELKLRPKYRPIRPKPYVPNLNNRKLFGMQPAVNISTLSPPKGFIVTTPFTCKEKNNQDVTIHHSAKSSGKTLNGNNNIMNKLDANDKIDDSSMIVSSPIKKEGRNNKNSSKSNKGSVELFFDSMAQTVMALPMHVQAEIKMEICKLVTMAEIKYSSSLSTAKQNYKNG